MLSFFFVNNLQIIKTPQVHSYSIFQDLLVEAFSMLRFHPSGEFVFKDSVILTWIQENELDKKYDSLFLTLAEIEISDFLLTELLIAHRYCCVMYFIFINGMKQMLYNHNDSNAK